MSDVAPGGPPGKTAVVVRAGPSRKRPIIIDAAVGILGLAFLLGAVALVDVLPDEDIVVPQYKAVISPNLEAPLNSIIDVDTGETVGNSGFLKYVTEGEEVSWTFDFTATNIYEVRVTLNVLDDRAATLPDVFSAFLEAPNGTTYPFSGTNGKFTTVETERNPSGPANGSVAPVYYVPIDVERQVTMVFRGFGNLPSNYLFTVEDIYGQPGDFELHEIQQAVRDREYWPDSVGHWKIHVVLEKVGHCPVANVLALDVERAQLCKIQNSWENYQAGESSVPSDPTADPEQDPGNPVKLANVSWSRFDVTVEEA